MKIWKKSFEIKTFSKCYLCLWLHPHKYMKIKPFKKGNSSSLCQSWLNSLYDLQKENYLLVFKHCICNEEFSFLWPLCCEFVYTCMCINISGHQIRYLMSEHGTWWTSSKNSFLLISSSVSAWFGFLKNHKVDTWCDLWTFSWSRNYVFWSKSFPPETQLQESRVQPNSDREIWDFIDWDCVSVFVFVFVFVFV